MKAPLTFLSLVVCTYLGGATAHSQINLSPERTGHAATLLNSGKVLITGGVNETATLDSALLFDPVTGFALPTGKMTAPRADHTSTLLADGKVLITGGDQGSVVLRTAEIYDPATGLFAAVPKNMRVARNKHSATLLQNGQVLIVGGKSADLYDPATQRFTSPTGIPVNRSAPHRDPSCPMELFSSLWRLCSAVSPPRSRRSQPKRSKLYCPAAIAPNCLRQSHGQFDAGWDGLYRRWLFWNQSTRRNRSLHSRDPDFRARSANDLSPLQS